MEQRMVDALQARQRTRQDKESTKDDIFEEVQRHTGHGGATALQVARGVGLSKGYVYRLLKEMEREGTVERRLDRHWNGALCSLWMESLPF